jgi:pimeloyl-ACP methyl ester carboxylesterase
MKMPASIFLAFALCGAVTASQAQPPTPRAGRPIPIGPVDTAQYHTRYVRLGQDGGGLYYEPNTLGPKARFALVLSHPNANNFTDQVGKEMASRGFRVLLIDYHGSDLAPEALPEDYLPTISRAIGYLRTLPGVERVLVIGHSGGGALTTLYGAVSEKGPSACQGADKIYPCNGRNIADLQKPDGLIIQEAPLGAFHRMSGLDAALTDHGRDPALDMYNSANGYNTATKLAAYSPDFVKRYYAAQKSRFDVLTAHAQERLNAIQQGKSDYDDDELMQVRGMGPNAIGARPYEADLRLASHTKKPHLILKADGSQVEAIAQSVRPSDAGEALAGLRKLNVMSVTTSVRHFLSTFALRTMPNYAITDDDIIGVDWHSAYNSPPANAEQITLPVLVMAGTCHYLFVPDEIIYDHLASKDKTYVIIDGATHGFGACSPQYGDVTKRTYDFVDTWLTKPGRF